MIELVPDCLVVVAGRFLVEPHDIHHGLRMFLLLLLGNPVLLQQSLPFPWQAGELPGPIVVSNVGYVHWIRGGRDLEIVARSGTQHIGDKAGEAVLFSPPRKL